LPGWSNEEPVKSRALSINAAIYTHLIAEEVMSAEGVISDTASVSSSVSHSSVSTAGDSTLCDMSVSSDASLDALHTIAAQLRARCSAHASGSGSVGGGVTSNRGKRKRLRKQVRSPA
jgi:hypothetical protein